MGKSDNPPHRHHYVPAAYLKRWAKPDGKLVQFSSPHPKKRLIKPNRKFPDGTGYLDWGYSLPGLTGEEAQALEKAYFNPIDDHFARILGGLEERGSDYPWTTDDKLKWARFLVTMLLRHPTDVEEIKAALKEDWLRTPADLISRYNSVATEDMPRTFAEFLANTPSEFIEREALKILVSFMETASLQRSLFNMSWLILAVPDGPEILTSDRPVMTSSQTNSAGFWLSMPLGPRTIFIAARSKDVAHGILRRDRTLLAKITSRGCLERAVRYGFGSDDSQLEFAKKHFGKKREESKIARMRRMHNKDLARKTTDR